MQTATKGQIRGIQILSDIPVQSKEFLQSSRGEPVHVRRCFHRLRSPKKDSPASAGHFFVSRNLARVVPAVNHVPQTYREATEMLDDLNRDTVDFVATYDERNQEPVVLPSKFPNLLVNRSGRSSLRARP